jgi:hypothetical protein
MHTLVRVPEKTEKELSMEERLRLIEDELAKTRQTLTEMKQTLGKLVGKSAEGSRSEPLTRGDLLAAVAGFEPAQPEEESWMTRGA